MMDKCKFCGKKLKTFTHKGEKHTILCKCFDKYVTELDKLKGDE